MSFYHSTLITSSFGILVAKTFHKRKTKFIKGPKMLSKFSVFIFLSLLSYNVIALPILTESADGTGLLATIYPDHENPKKFYFFPNTGGLEKDETGVPRFGMSYWKAEEGNTTAGYFSGIFRLGLTADLSEAINNYKKTGKQISVIPVQESHLYFMEDKDGNRLLTDLYKEISMPPFSGRAEDSIGISASLTKSGALMLASILSNGGNGADLKYCYEIKGVSPIFHAKIDLNYHKIYKHFLAQARGGRMWWKWSVRTEVEKLVEDGDIKIQINGGTANQYDYIMSLADRMIQKFMEPILDNRRGSTSGRFGISETRIIEDRELSFELKERELISREYCVSLGLGELKSFPWLITKTEMN